MLYEVAPGPTCFERFDEAGFPGTRSRCDVEQRNPIGSLRMIRRRCIFRSGMQGSSLRSRRDEHGMLIFGAPCSWDCTAVKIFGLPLLPVL